MLSDNNPLNIRYSKYNVWRGMTGSHKGFCVFANLSFGVRAAILLLKTYYFKYHLRTIRSIIERYAPSCENDTEAYISFVSKKTYIDPNRKIAFDDIVYSVLPAMSLFESSFKLDLSVISYVVSFFKINIYEKG